MLIKSLRSEPEIFEPVYFKSGINIITGERSGDSGSAAKTNGVGKTHLIHFIDFCLLADLGRNRINKIPEEILPKSTAIILDLEVKGRNISIKRKPDKKSIITIYIDGQSTVFEGVDSARKYLGHCFFEDTTTCSFRSLIRIFKRAEKVGYNEIDDPDGEASDIIPFLYVFGLDVELYKRISDKAQALRDAYKYDGGLTKDIEEITGSIKEAVAYVNDLSSQLKTIDNAVETLSQKEIYDTISSDIASLDHQIERTNLQLASIKEELRQIDRAPEYQEIRREDILAVYNDCKKSLGDLIVKEIEEIQEFKAIVDSFKLSVVAQRKKELLSEKDKLLVLLQELSEQYKKVTSVLDNDGNLRSLKVTLREQELKRQQYSKISFLYDQHLQQESKKVSLAAERGNALVEFRNNRDEKHEAISSFQTTVLEIHQYLYGNRRASFDIVVKEAKRPNQKTFATFDMQIDDSGSARTEHEKVLIFDYALMFCPITELKHPGFLIHDGAFEGVNEDTKFQLLNWLQEKQVNSQFQYIVTINRDSFELLEQNGNFSFDLNDAVVAEYDKDHRFLKRKFIPEK